MTNGKFEAKQILNVIDSHIDEAESDLEAKIAEEEKYLEELETTLLRLRRVKRRATKKEEEGTTIL
jgi:hypothetical protein